jgi:hypothetical protein
VDVAARQQLNRDAVVLVATFVAAVLLRRQMWAVTLVGMPYIQPPWRTRKFFNRFAVAVGLGAAETLTVMGRFSKKPQKIPVSPIEVNGVRYLVSTYGESHWVKNVRANPTIALNGIEYLAAEIPVAARKPILDAFKAKFAKYVDDYFRQLPNDADHPVFSLTTKMGQRR